MWQNKCFCSQTVGFEDENKSWNDAVSFPVRAPLILERSRQRQRGADGALLAPGKTKRKASEPGGRGGDAEARTIRKEIYCIYSHLFLSPKRNAVLIKEVDHFRELWHVGWLLFFFILLATKPDGNYEPYMSNVWGVWGGWGCKSRNALHYWHFKKKATGPF